MQFITAEVTQIDFYVPVIDNYGDMGFALNFALSFHERYPEKYIQFYSDDRKLFLKFFPESIPEWMEYRGLDSLTEDNPPAPSRLIFSFFDFKYPKAYLAEFPYPKTIVSFSYFLLHKGLESLHGTTYLLESGYDTVIHFIPSLVSGGGGIIINPLVDAKKEGRAGMFSGLGKVDYEKKWVSVFVYEKTLSEILPVIDKDTSETIYWLCGDVSGLQESSHYRILPFLSLVDYGHFQSLCDVNIVRGENSLCQGLISGNPVLWDIYKESNGAHTEKIEDYLAFLRKRFPETDWTEYTRIMRRFNSPGDTGLVFTDFISGYREYETVFRKLSVYIRKECDLLQKLEVILKK